MSSSSFYNLIIKLSELYKILIIKSPKLYFYDSGLLAYLLKIKNYLYHGGQSPLYFWHAQSGVEVDVLID